MPLCVNKIWCNVSTSASVNYRIIPMTSKGGVFFQKNRWEEQNRRIKEATVFVLWWMVYESSSLSDVARVCIGLAMYFHFPFRLGTLTNIFSLLLGNWPQRSFRNANSSGVKKVTKMPSVRPPPRWNGQSNMEVRSFLPDSDDNVGPF